MLQEYDYEQDNPDITDELEGDAGEQETISVPLFWVMILLAMALLVCVALVSRG